MDDYEKLQWELQELYTVYLERFRNLEYLEMELDHLDRAEQEKMEDADRHLKKMQRKMRDEVRCVRNCFRTSKREREREHFAARARRAGGLASSSVHIGFLHRTLPCGRDGTLSTVSAP
jgi:hypothetical protein